MVISVAVQHDVYNELGQHSAKISLIYGRGALVKALGSLALFLNNRSRLKADKVEYAADAQMPWATNSNSIKPVRELEKEQAV